jgi:hypothetical protein
LRYVCGGDNVKLSVPGWPGWSGRLCIGIGRDGIESRSVSTGWLHLVEPSVLEMFLRLLVRSDSSSCSSCSSRGGWIAIWAMFRMMCSNARFQGRFSRRFYHNARLTTAAPSAFLVPEACSAGGVLPSSCTTHPALTILQPDQRVLKKAICVSRPPRSLGDSIALPLFRQARVQSGQVHAMMPETPLSPVSLSRRVPAFHHPRCPRQHHRCLCLCADTP